MKLVNYFLPFLSLCLLVSSCSKDEIIDTTITPEKEYNAVLSLVIKGDDDTQTQTKADAKAAKFVSYYYIERLSIAVFDVQNKLLAFKESTDETESVNGVASVGEISVPAGRVKVLVLANAIIPEQLKAVDTPLSEYEKLRVNLEDEIVGKLTMSSGVLTYDLKAGNNFVGYGKKNDTEIEVKGEKIKGFELTGSPIELIRNISNLQLDVLALHPSSNFMGYGKVSFHFKALFVANVKSRSYLFSTSDKWGPVEVPAAEANWFAGAYPTETGDLKENQSTLKKTLFYDFVTPPVDIPDYNAHYPNLNGIWDYLLSMSNIDGRDKNGNLTPLMLTFSQGSSKPSQIHHSSGAGIPWGVNFFIYENKNETDDHTLLIVQGDYTYTPEKNGKPVTLKDRFYTVIVNKDGTSDDTSSTKHTYVRKNYYYGIVLTINGPGSDKPYDRLSTSHINAAVKVRDWHVVEMKPDVD